MNNISPRWIETAITKTGEDHLGVQAYSISLYSKLFPGLTNLTQRVRYYSIYPWFLSNYIKQVGIKNDRKKWRDFLRRCEFLYALVSITDPDEKSVMGSQLAKKVLNESNNKIQFSKYTDIKKGSEVQYWTQSYGGYGQYYLGSLQSLDIIFFDGNDEIEYLGENGKLLVEAVDEIIPLSTSEKFFKNVISGSVETKDLEELSKFLKPSKIVPNSSEAEVLRKILFEDIHQLSDQNRVGSFKLLLNLIDQFAGSEKLDLYEIRYMLLHRSYVNAKKFKILPGLEIFANSWKAFFVGELVNYSLESLFWACLQQMKTYSKMNLNSFAHNISVYIININQKPKLWTKADARELNFSDFMKSIYSKIETDDNYWYKEKFSTFNLVENIRESVGSANIDNTCYYSILLFSKLYAQYHDSKELYEVYKPDTEMGEHFSEFNPLLILNNEYLNPNNGVEEGLSGLINYYLLQRHLRVALAKLRIPPNQSTFKFVLRESNVEWLEDIRPTFTGPRISTALNFLEDLGLINREKKIVTKLGKNYLL